MLINQNPAVSKTDSGIDYLNEALIEKLWYELDEQVSREQIRQVAAQVAAQFKHATVTTFIPIFVYRETYEKLKNSLSKEWFLP